MTEGWPTGYEKGRTLRIATMGRKTDRRHEVTTDFVVDDGRLFVVTRDPKRDWVKNALKNSLVEVTIYSVTRKMITHPLKSDLEKEAAHKLFQKKHIFLRIARMLIGTVRREEFELKLL